MRGVLAPVNGRDDLHSDAMPDAPHPAWRSKKKHNKSRVLHQEAEFLESFNQRNGSDKKHGHVNDVNCVAENAGEED